MKLYYLTNTLNIDNILTSECLSPLSVYSLRKFGYNSFESAPLGGKVDISNSILLFAKIPYYRVDSKELECAPMILEITDTNLDTMVEDISQHRDASVFLVKGNQSIVLTPINCRILFTDMRAYRMARLKCQDSKCNKWWEYFEMEIININKSVVLEDMLKGISIKNISSPNIHKEILVNRQKGLLWGYVLGYFRSLPSNIARLRAIQKNIYNNVASIINAGGKALPTFVDRIKTLDEKYREIDPVRNQLISSWNNELKELNFNNDQTEFLYNTLEMYTPLLYAYAKYNKVQLRTPIFTGVLFNFSWSLYQEALVRHTQAIIKSALESKDKNIQLKDKFINTDNGLTTFGNSEQDDIFALIIQNLLLSQANPLTIEHIRVDKLNVVKRFNEIYKNCKGNEYKTSEIYEYMLGIVHCIRDNESFDPLSTEDVLLQNIAAFILKGDSFEDMMTYMIEKGISTFEYATAMWCACEGYVDLSRNIIHSLSSQDVNLSIIYNQVYALVYGMDINLQLNKQPQVFKESSQTMFHADSRFMQFPMQIQEKIEEAKKLEAKVQNREAFLKILDSFIAISNPIYKALKNGLKRAQYDSKEEFKAHIEEICQSCVNKLDKIVPGKRWKGEQYTYRKAINLAFELEAEIGNQQAFLYILDNYLSPSSEEYQNILSILALKPQVSKSNSIQKHQKKVETSRNLFSTIEPSMQNIERCFSQSEQSSFLFTNNILEDCNCWIKDCKDFIVDKNAKEQFEKDMFWYVDNYKERYYDIKKKEFKSGIFAKRSKDTADVIKHLKDWCESRRDNPERNSSINWLMPIYSKIPITQIIDYLRQKYAN